MRGGSFHQSFIMVDEAQNLEVATIAAIATRLAEGSKMVFLGNFSQIDNYKLRVPEKNGLFRLLDGLYEGGYNDVFEHVNLTTVERHKAVYVVEKILRDHEMNETFAELEARGN
jgi:predicted ribonuclease YlaK